MVFLGGGNEIRKKVHQMAVSVKCLEQFMTALLDLLRLFICPNYDICTIGFRIEVELQASLEQW